MLKPIRRRQATTRHSDSTRVAVVASEYNRKHVDSLLRGAESVLKKAGVQVDVIRVPGAFEIPLAAEIAAAEGGAAATVCLGVIIRGETAHADLVGEAVTRALMEIGLRHRVPVSHEVLLVDTVAQADERCLNPRHNRGVEAATTALAMLDWMRRFRSGKALDAIHA